MVEQTFATHKKTEIVRGLHTDKAKGLLFPNDAGKASAKDICAQ